MEAIQLYSSFCHYLVTAEGSPLLSSLRRLDLDAHELHDNLAWPFCKPPAATEAMAAEARKLATALATMAKQDASKAFDQKIAESLSCGDSWLHKWAKHEKPTS